MKFKQKNLQFLVSMIYDLLLNDDRVLIVYNYPESMESSQELEDHISRKLVNYHPRLTSPFQLMATPIASTVKEILRLLDWHRRGIVFVDYHSFCNLKKGGIFNTLGAQIHLYRSGRFTVLVPVKRLKTMSLR